MYVWKRNKDECDGLDLRLSFPVIFLFDFRSIFYLLIRLFLRATLKRFSDDDRSESKKRQKIDLSLDELYRVLFSPQQGRLYFI